MPSEGGETQLGTVDLGSGRLLARRHTTRGSPACGMLANCRANDVAAGKRGCLRPTVRRHGEARLVTTSRPGLADPDGMLISERLQECMNDPTPDMRSEAASAGRIQLGTHTFAANT